MSKSKYQTKRLFSGEWNVEKVISKVKEQTDDSFYLCNLSDVVKKFDDWVEKMPRVKPFYAVSFGNSLRCFRRLKFEFLSAKGEVQ
jgi:diaminopimelate decarboxylase